MPNIQIYDTTLRDGTQSEGFTLSGNDKIRIARKLECRGRSRPRGRPGPRSRSGRSCPSGTGQVYGIFTTQGGTVLGAPFAIDGNGDGHFPRARFSADLNGGQGGFMVAWSEEMPNNFNVIRVKTVAYGPGGAPILGQRNTINGLGSFSWIESGPAIGYSPVSQRFLVAWRTYPFLNDPYLAAVLVGLDGQTVSGVIRLSSALGRDPGVAWDPNTNRFGVSFTAENSAGTYGFASFASVSPIDGSFVRDSFSQVVGFGYISDVDFNPDTGRFVMTWHQKPGGQSEVQVAEISASAGGVAVVSQGLVTRLWPAYDALSLARNPSSRTLSIVSLSGSALSDDDVAAVELNQNGYRTSALIVLGPDVTARYPRVSSSTGGAG